MLKKIKKIFYREVNENEINYKKAREILNKTNGILLDVRSLQEYNEDHLPGAININLYEIKEKVLRQIPNKGATIIVYCTCRHS